MTESTPSLSVVLRVIEGTAGVERCVAALRRQAGRDEVEIIAPVSAHVAAQLSSACRAEIEILEIDDDVRWRDLAPASALHARCDAGSSRGLAAARAGIIASLEDTAMPSETWVRTVLDAHRRQPHEAIGGPIDVEAGGAAAWAAFWLDFRPYVPPQAPGEVGGLSDVNVSYKRQAIMAVQPAWRSEFNEYLVHGAFRAMGGRFLMAPGMAVTLRRPTRRLPVVLAERFHWGRVFGAARREAMPTSNTIAHVLAVPVLPVMVTSRVVRVTRGHPRHGRAPGGGWLALLACSTAWCAGELVGQVSGRPYRVTRSTGAA